MDTQSIRYFIELVKNMHFTKTAQQLYISQQNLSQHIKKLEEYYDTPLFYRKPKLKLTPAGEALYESFQKIVLEEDNARLKIDDILCNNVGTMTIGASAYRGQFWIPRVFPEFIAKWPNVSTKIVMERSAKMEQSLITGDLDFFVGIKASDDSLLRVIPLMNDKVYLVMTKTLMRKYFGEDAEELISVYEKGTSLKPFKNVPFFRLFSNYRLREQVNLCFAEAGYTPKQVLEVSNIETMLSFIPFHIAAFVCTGMRVPYLKETYPDTCFFPILLDNKFIYSSLSIVYHKDHYFPQYSLDFIKHLRAFFDEFNVKTDYEPNTMDK